MRIRRAALLAAMVLAVLALSPDPLLGQCAMCRNALDSPEGRELAAAFQRGILLLLAAPFGAVATIGLLIVRAHRRAASGELDESGPVRPTDLP